VPARRAGFLAFPSFSSPSRCWRVSGYWRASQPPDERRGGLNLCPGDADARDVKRKMRLDAVVMLRERAEDKARLELAEAQTKAMAASQALQAAAARIRRDERKSGRAVDWDVAESAHARVLVEHRIAEREATDATQKLGSTRELYVGARAKAEALRRIVDARRVELVREEDSAEQKQLDELATLLHGRD
jgi:flagellar biosynthesis chaperone FliJ